MFRIPDEVLAQGPAFAAQFAAQMMGIVTAGAAPAPAPAAPAANQTAEALRAEKPAEPKSTPAVRFFNVGDLMSLGTKTSFDTHAIASKLHAACGTKANAALVRLAIDLAVMDLRGGYPVSECARKQQRRGTDGHRDPESGRGSFVNPAATIANVAPGCTNADELWALARAVTTALEQDWEIVKAA